MRVNGIDGRFALVSGQAQFFPLDEINVYEAAYANTCEQIRDANGIALWEGDSIRIAANRTGIVHREGKQFFLREGTTLRSITDVQSLTLRTAVAT